MGTQFLTQKKALTKADTPGGTNDFAKKSWLASQDKFDLSKLTKYGNNDFVIDDDIIKKPETVDPDPTPEEKWMDVLLDFNNGGSLYDFKVKFNFTLDSVNELTQNREYLLESNNPITFKVKQGASVQCQIMRVSGTSQPYINTVEGILNYQKQGPSCTLSFIDTSSSSYSISISFT